MPAQLREPQKRRTYLSPPMNTRRQHLSSNRCPFHDVTSLVPFQVMDSAQTRAGIANRRSAVLVAGKVTGIGPIGAQAGRRFVKFSASGGLGRYRGPGRQSCAYGTGISGKSSVSETSNKMHDIKVWPLLDPKVQIFVGNRQATHSSLRSRPWPVPRRISSPSMRYPSRPRLDTIP